MVDFISKMVYNNKKFKSGEKYEKVFNKFVYYIIYPKFSIC